MAKASDRQRPMTAAEIREISAARSKKKPTEIVELKSGAVYELRRPDLHGMMMTGSIPQSLIAEFQKARKKTDEDSGDESKIKLNDDAVLGMLIMMREVVHNCTVSPKFVEFATNDNEIGASDMDSDDFLEIFTWATGYEGVAGLDGLKSFRAGRERGTSSDSPVSEELRTDAESETKTESVVQ